MITVEYLIFNDKKDKICIDRKSFESLIQTDSNITISKNKITYKDDFEADYYLEVGEIVNSSNMYFNITISISSENCIDELTELLRSFKKRFRILTDSPQVLIDGISQHYACKAYPLLYEVENLMRKLLTKFMLINAGINWKVNRVPDDVSQSIKKEDEGTYLHNLDFIQLKDIIFSEKYSSQKDSLIEKLKSTSDFSSLDLEELKKMLPMSNWSRYFADAIEIDSKKLSSNWTTLYKLRCKVAHNKIFSRADYETTVKLIEETKPALLNAIDRLKIIDIESEFKGNIEENIFGSLDYELGQFFAAWREFERKIYSWIIVNKGKQVFSSHTNLNNNLKHLGARDFIDFNTSLEIENLQSIKNKISHFDESITVDEINEAIVKIENMTENINNIHGNILKLI